jgi:hypothetical protein
MVRPLRPGVNHIPDHTLNGDTSSKGAASSEGEAHPPAASPARSKSQPKGNLSREDEINLQQSGITNDTIVANGIYSEADKVRLATLLNRLPETPRKQIPQFCWFGAMVIPYRDLDGKLNGFVRCRPHSPRIVEGKTAKYEQPKGSPLRAYFPAASLPKLRDGTSDIYITEGEKKALALAQVGLAAVGIGGIWCGCKNQIALIDDLTHIHWLNRVVYIVFDYDPKEETSRQVQAARGRLATVLRIAGASEVYAVKLPPGPEGAKQGVDDFLAAPGADGNGAFEQLVADATPIIQIIPSRSGGPAGIPIIKIIPPVLGEAAYHGPIGNFLHRLAPYTEATDAGVLAQLLPAIGTIIGPGPRIHGTKQPARVNSVLVGPTSTGRKGTALDPVDELMMLVCSDFWREQRVNGLSTGEGVVEKVADKKTTDEEGNETIIPVEKRLCVVEEEFSKVLAQIRRDGNILSQILRESYDSGNLAVLTRHNPLQALGAHIAIIGHITPEELHDRFNHIEMANGFGNRFLWFAVKSDKVLTNCQPIPEAVYRELIQHVWRVNNSPAQHVPLAAPAMGRWEVIYPSLREDRPGMTGHLLARGSSLVLRLALLYYLLDPPLKGVSKGVSPVHLDAAMAVWTYCEESVQMLFKTKSGTLLGDKVLALLSSGPMTKDKLNDHLSPKQKEEIDKVLANLEAARQIVKTTEKKGGPGRPATCWKLPG